MTFPGCGLADLAGQRQFTQDCAGLKCFSWGCSSSEIRLNMGSKARIGARPGSHPVGEHSGCSGGAGEAAVESGYSSDLTSLEDR